MNKKLELYELKYTVSALTVTGTLAKITG